MTTKLAPPGAALMHDALRLRDTLGLSNREARSEAELLLVRALNITRARLIAEPGLAAEAKTNATYGQWLKRRLAGEPIAYILSAREFYGHVFTVTPDVLIPRPETELLVDMALERIPPDADMTVLDLGTGSGAIAITIALQRPHVRVVGLDASAASLRVAKLNCERLLGNSDRLSLVHSDWFDALAGTTFDMIVSNPPYVAEGDTHLSKGDIRFEPRQALLGGPGGLDALERITRVAPRHLAAGGWLLCEHGYDQAEAVKQMLIGAGLCDVVSERDLAGVLRVSGGRRLTRSVGTG
ncbi:MAG: peptide chain release factor N(5)-glutamine methyltransferase [Betaproteobacteria bacterium]|nr:MAG: peptide chain release factor N(5)-glutamine methyltransferase [Betaproteobacteria bacterium]